ncbi:hypothetical protein [Sphingobium bisphenolivorans]|uniref:hypothetical protein n=1 Tax=Sphingobium bisphenolivorans TaxID=1335760 RepID=UPI0003A08599|nr:hypothetical protein [Sphingobium bisphenolivorans]
MTRILGPLAVGLMILGAQEPALAASCATVTVSPATPTIPEWNPLSGEIKEATFSVTVTRESASTKSVRWMLLDDNGNGSPLLVGASGPRYEIVSSGTGNTTIAYPKGTPLTAALGALAQFNNKNDAAFSLKVRLLANSSRDFVGGTRYQEALRYSAQCFKANGSDNGADDGLLSGLRLDMAIPRMLSINTAGPAQVDFQDFTSDTAEALISIKSTSTLDVLAATDNGARLKMGTSTAENAVIPYQMRFGPDAAGSLPLLSPGTPLNTPRAGVGGSNYALQLKLTGGVPSGKIAGTYSDTITLTISPGN